MNIRQIFIWLPIISTIIIATRCSEKSASHFTEPDKDISTAFELIHHDSSGIRFKNIIRESVNLNYFNFLHLYMGGGVAVADFNNDDLPDIYFTGNLTPNKLYINKGNFKFEDVTIEAGVSASDGFKAGVTIADVNQDGWMDIYVCRAGWFKEARRLQNLLYINNGNLTFSEEAEKYGLADANYSTDAVFFDYDRDNDLDCFVVNTPTDFDLTNKPLNLEAAYNDPFVKNLKCSNKLYENVGEDATGQIVFKEVSEKSGILNDVGFGLGASVGDLNNDQYPDIYVSNDFLSPDYLYMNNGDGTFSEKSYKMLKHISWASMGSDIGDINNDGLLDLMVLDMAFEDPVRSKTTSAMVNREAFQIKADNGYHYQYPHNMLHLNNGVSSNGKQTFSEIAQLAGIEKSEWSWSPLLADFNLDGLKDIYITNGIQRNMLDRDALAAWNQMTEQTGGHINQKILNEYLARFPSDTAINRMYKNNGNLTFTKVIKDWNMDHKGWSNGAAYADFDNDGDLDLVMNNLNQEAYLYKNQAREKGGNYLSIEFKGSRGNINGIGTRVWIETDLGKQMGELILSRGYLSASEPILHFGLGDATMIYRIIVQWPDGSTETLENVNGNQLLVLDYQDAKKHINILNPFEHVPRDWAFKADHNNDGLFQHQETSYDDYQKQLLLPHQLSLLGPDIDTADVDRDGLTDFFIGGAGGHEGGLFIQQQDGNFKKSHQPQIRQYRHAEDIGVHFFDANNDRLPDLYIASGSYELSANDAALQDRLYINDGNGNYYYDKSALPEFKTVTQSITSGDMDNDGDMDLFVGGRIVPGKYPYAPRSYVLQNEHGKFSDVTEAFNSELADIGMVTKALWHDLNKDGNLDLILSGEWMPITIFINDGKRLINETASYGLDQTTGWWFDFAIADLNNDGNDDFIGGNIGLNYKYKASREKPLHVFCNDFDNNGTFDIVLAQNVSGSLYPLRGMDYSSQQMPFLKNKFKTYESFARADLYEIYEEKRINSSLHLSATEFKSMVFMSEGNNFKSHPLPNDAQVSVIQSILVKDINGDRHPDLIIAGNLYETEVETTRADAGVGRILLNDGEGNFTATPPHLSGFYADGNVKSMALIDNGHLKIFVGNNNGKVEVFVSKLNNHIQ